jgi:hypothetical protein
LVSSIFHSHFNFAITNPKLSEFLVSDPDPDVECQFIGRHIFFKDTAFINTITSKDKATDGLYEMFVLFNILYFFFLKGK